MSDCQIPEALQAEAPARRKAARQSLGLSAGETVHLSRAAASVLAGLSERQLRLAGEELFFYFETRHDLLALQADQIERPPEAKEFPARLREIGRQLKHNARRSRLAGLDKRLNWLAGLLALDKAETMMLGVMARLAMFESWRQLMQAIPFKIDNPSGEILALITGLSLADVDERLLPGSRLIASGMVIDDHDGEYRAGRLLVRIARSTATRPELLMQRIMPRAPSSSLAWEDFDHIGPLRDLCERVIASGEPVSILFHGLPGTGKTEFARLLADRAMRRAVFAGLDDERGGEPTRYERLSHLILLRALGKGADDAMAIVDEADDVLRIVHTHDAPGSKQWLNRIVEDPQVPTIWILNDPDLLDPALVRRMTLAIAFDTPPFRTRTRIAARAAEAQGLVLAEAELAGLAALEAEPAVVAAGMQVARLASGGEAEARLGTESVLKALGRRRIAAPPPDACYDFSLAASDCDLEQLAQQLAQAPERGWSLLLAGPSGTGKSAFARHLALRLGIEVEERRGSDLLGAYVGETEKRIATAFARAAERGAMLLIDEADSFLFRREAGQRSWETGMVNEMLRWMEHPRAPFVATTNLADRLDPAMQRRFTLRVNFAALAPRQAQALFAARFGLPVPASLAVLHSLTPGDFAAVHQRARLLGEERADVLAEWLGVEVALRGDVSRPMGFQVPEPSMRETPRYLRIEQPCQ